MIERSRVRITTGVAGEFSNATLSPPERFCIQMDSDLSHFNVTLILRDKVTMSTDHNRFEEEEEVSK